MIRKTFFVIIFFVFINCNDTGNNIEKKYPEVFTAIKGFIKTYPFKVPHFIGEEYPSYTVRFVKGSKDLEMIIKLMNFALEMNITNDKMEKIKPDGVYWLSKKIPIVFYGTQLYDKNFSNYLSTVPDSLMYNSGIIYHYIKIDTFVLKNNTFVNK